jgi:hypothetical protein
MTSLRAIIDAYTDFEVEGRQVKLPYALAIARIENEPAYVMGRTDARTYFAGKGTPEQLRESLRKAAKEKDFDLTTARADEITTFMVGEGIGIDCSGFVYNVLDAWLRGEGGVSLDKLILRKSGWMGKIERLLLRKNRVRRSSAATLTSDLNSIRVPTASEAQPGDMIRLTHSDWAGKHIAIVVDKDDRTITYAHSSEFTKIQGPHHGIIKILDWSRDLDQQEWQEVTQEGKNYGTYAFDPKRGDSIRRLKFLG